MRNAIRLGDPTSHGGKVESVIEDHFTVDGIQVARVGDVCSCPIMGHDNRTIAEEDPDHIDGVAVARNCGKG